MMHWFDNYGYGMGHGIGWFFMILFWVLIVLLVLYAVKLASRGNSGREPDRKAGEILKERYARGEISREEYKRMKEDISS